MHPLCGQHNDAFIVSIRARLLGRPIQPTTDPYTKGRRLGPYTARNSERPSHKSLTGYRDLAKACWPVMNTTRCAHDVSSNRLVKLLPDCEAFTGFNIGNSLIRPQGKVVILLTGGHTLMRWRALRALATANGVKNGDRRTYLRHDCCLECAIDQRLKSPERSVLVL